MTQVIGIDVNEISEIYPRDLRPGEVLDISTLQLVEESYFLLSKNSLRIIFKTLCIQM